MLMAILFFGVFTTQAATVTYTLTSHVDGRNITGTANLNAGADLLNSMPQALWRGYTNYTFYKDAAKTQPISNWEEGVNTVYVDYEFDPPFQLSDDTKTVWNYFRNSPGTGDNRVIYYSVYKKEHFYTQKNLSTGSMTLKYKENAKWAFYGDAFNLTMKFDLHSDQAGMEGSNYLLPQTVSNGDYPQIGAKPAVGFQLYENSMGGGYFSLGLPDADKFLYTYDVGDYIKIVDRVTTGWFGRETVHFNRNDQNYMSGEDMNQYAFVITPASDDPTITEYWHVTYKILKADGETWYPDYVMQKYSSKLTPDWPPTGFTRVEGCDYDYFYLDADFSQKCADDYTMPDGQNTVLYIRELKYVSTPWMTLVLPFGIDNLPAYFGADDAVQVNEYTSVEGKLNGSGNSFSCKLNFIATDKIEAGKPYLFKADKVSQAVLDAMYATEVPALPELIEVKKYDTNAPGIGVSMKGVLGSEYSMPNDGMHFYFGSKQNGDDYTYGFYLRGATIKPNRCYFFVTDERAGATSPLTLNFGDNGFTGIGQMTVEATANEAIYSISGQQMRTTSTANLPKGLYIVNGKKIIVK